MGLCIVSRAGKIWASHSPATAKFSRHADAILLGRWDEPRYCIAYARLTLPVFPQAQHV